MKEQLDEVVRNAIEDLQVVASYDDENWKVEEYTAPRDTLLQVFNGTQYFNKLKLLEHDFLHRYYEFDEMINKMVALAEQWLEENEEA